MSAAGLDGATVDADGCYWMAGFGGWQVVRITPDGRADRIIEMPVEKPSKVMFGGAALDTLYVTSISEGTGEAGAVDSASGDGCSAWVRVPILLQNI